MKDKFTEVLIGVVESVKETLPTGRNKYNGSVPIWHLVYNQMKELYPTRSFTKEGLRGRYRNTSKEEKSKGYARTYKHRSEVKGRTTLESKILPLIRKKLSVAKLADMLLSTESDVLAAIMRLTVAGYSEIKVWDEDGTLFVKNTIKKTPAFEEIDHAHLYDSDEIKIAVISDTHFGSEYCAEDALEKFYDYVEALGIKDVYHAGDLTEGYKSSRVETFLGNKAIGFDAQLAYTIKNYPKREGIKTHVISGNHDDFYIQEGLANIVKTVAVIRDDINYLGDDFARVWLTPNLDMTLYHPNDGSAANVHHKAQRFIENGGSKVSKINIIAHYHKTLWMKHKGSYALLSSSFQKQSNWMNQNNLTSNVGGYILNIKVDKEGNLLALDTEYVDFE